MLIVVAIIAILIAISIPLVDSALQKARHSTDAANERAAKAAMMIGYLDNTVTIASGATESAAWAYDAKEGKIVSSGTVSGYGQHKGHTKSHYIVMTINTDGVIKMVWNTSISTSGGIASLCSSSTSADHS